MPKREAFSPAFPGTLCVWFFIPRQLGYLISLRAFDCAAIWIRVSRIKHEVLLFFREENQVISVLEAGDAEGNIIFCFGFFHTRSNQKVIVPLHGRKVMVKPWYDNIFPHWAWQLGGCGGESRGLNEAQKANKENEFHKLAHFVMNLNGRVTSLTK